MDPTDEPGITDASARYLVAAFQLWAAGEGRVQTGAIARRLAVEPSSVTGMVGKLDDAGYLDHDPHRGVVPTPRGVALARAISRRGCVVEAFFEALGAPVGPDRAHAVGLHLPAVAIDRLAEATEHACRDRCRAAESGFADCPRLADVEVA